MMIKRTIVALSTALLFACGGDGDGDGDGDGGIDSGTATAQTGVFLDSAVSGISYETESLSGVTNQAGEFSFVAGESVIFSVGDVVLPKVTAIPVITPLTIAGSSQLNDESLNIARFLQTLDDDQDPTNGLQMPSTLAWTESIGFADTIAFESDMYDLLNQNNIVGDLVTVAEAQVHLEDTLDNLAPTQFTADYLQGRTFYVVEKHEEHEEGTHVLEVAFDNSAQTAFVTGIHNETWQGLVYYDVDSQGYLYSSESESPQHSGDEFEDISQWSTVDYIHTQVFDNGNQNFKGSNLWFFDRAEAIAYAEQLDAGEVEFSNECELIVRQVPEKTITIDGTISDWQGVTPILKDPIGDINKSAVDLTAVYVAKDSQYIYVRMDKAGTAMPPARHYVSNAVMLTTPTSNPDMPIEQGYYIQYFLWVNEIHNNGKRASITDATLPDYTDWPLIADDLSFHDAGMYIEIAIPISYINTELIYNIHFSSTYSVSADTWDDGQYEDHSLNQCPTRVRF
ncbi:hypothetical protein ACPV5V_18390 [Vibrio campbellii]